MQQKPKRSIGRTIGSAVGVVFVCVVGAAVISVLTDGPTEPAASAPTAARLPTATAAPTTPPRGYISRATWPGKNWPLTIDAGVLRCQPRKTDNALLTDIVLDADGKTYALNGTAQAGVKAGVYLPIDGIAAPDKSEVIELISMGLKLCPI